MMSFNPIMAPWLLALLLALPLAAFVFMEVRRPYESAKVKAAEISVAAVIFACLVVIGLRPCIPESVVDESDSANRDVDVLFVLDTTMSMWATDAPDGGTRISLAQKNCEQIMAALPGADFAMIRFDDAARVIAPFTKDSETISDLFEIIGKPESFMSRGSNMSTPKSQLATFLVKSSQKRSDDLVIFFMTDGEETNEGGSVSYADLAGYISGGAVIGYGTPEGGKMVDDYGPVLDPETGKEGVSVMDEQMLRRIAGELGVGYVHSTDSDGIAAIAQGIADKSGLSTDSESKERKVLSDVYWMAVPALMLALLAEFALVVRRRKAEVS